MSRYGFEWGRGQCPRVAAAPGYAPAPLAHSSRRIGAMQRTPFSTCGRLSIGQSAYSRPSTGATKAVCQGGESPAHAAAAVRGPETQPPSLGRSPDFKVAPMLGEWK